MGGASPGRHGAGLRFPLKGCARVATESERQGLRRPWAIRSEERPAGPAKAAAVSQGRPIARPR
jgi:hypothetical protein